VYKDFLYLEEIMVVAPDTLREDYWSTFELQETDFEFIYNHLLETETPLTTQELMATLVRERLRLEKIELERQRSTGGAIYYPKDDYKVNQNVTFPALGWRRARVDELRPGKNPELGEFNVIQVRFEDGEKKEFASGLQNHKLNQPVDFTENDKSFDADLVLKVYGEDLSARIAADLETNPDFVRIAGKWFPRALLVDINPGHLNLAEAVLDMAGGGPRPTADLMKEIDLPVSASPKLVEFSLDMAMQEDPRFDEVGPAGVMMWYLQRLEPEEVQRMPLWLRYSEIEYDRSLLTPAMLTLERELDDELTPSEGRLSNLNEVQVRLIYPHLRAGTLPLSARIRHLFPTAHETPRILFMLVDSDNGHKFPAWVARTSGYVYGLQEWYQSKGLMPGNLVRVRHGDQPGEVIVQAENRRSREYVRTVLVGSDGGIVYAMLKQQIVSGYDERMTVAIPDVEALDQVWKNGQKDRTPFERIVVNTVRELARLNPQSHVHASELYAALNVVRRCPPGPILALLASRPWFVHVGDLHFRFDDSEKA
jgi:hypothetical protein